MDPNMSTRNWWSLCDVMGRVQLAWYATSNTSRDDSDRWRVRYILSNHLHPFMYIVHSNGHGQFYQGNATPHTSRLLSSGSKSTIMTLDTTIGHLNPQTWRLLSISRMPCNVLLRRDIHHLTHQCICGLPCRIHVLTASRINSEISLVHITSCGTFACS